MVALPRISTRPPGNRPGRRPHSGQHAKPCTPVRPAFTPYRIIVTGTLVPVISAAAGAPNGTLAGLPQAAARPLNVKPRSRS